ncbi:MAG: sodium:proton antiporter [Fimbriimonadaceae bacterium]|nr:sodium:proton antiporter [Fimbriimonadaceae bacterium]
MNGLSLERVEILLLVAAVVALLARRFRLPYTVGLVVAGAVLALTGVLQGFTLTRELVFRALLPPLIFEAAFFIRWKELRENLKPVLALATFGVALSTLIIAGFMAWLGGWSFAAAAVFGALIAATDPVSVIALFKEMKVGGRLRLLVEAESLLNDGAAAVAFAFALAVVTSGGLTAVDGFVLILREVGGGVLCGAVTAGVMLLLAGTTEEHLVELTFSTLTAFGAFLLAEHFHCSGVLAVLTAGLMLGNLGPYGAISEAGRGAVGAFWEFAAFVANSIIFLLIGVREMTLGPKLVDEIPVIVLAIVGSQVARAISVYGVCGTLHWTKSKVTWTHQHILFWGGLKGALSLALVLSLPDNFPHRDQLQAAAFGVVAFSVIIQGLTVPALMRKLGLAAQRP